MGEGCQLVLLGSGRADLENNLRCALRLMLARKGACLKT
jgi:hypothetical protein